MARQSVKREIRKTYVVLGDGQTEQYYLKHLKELKGYRYIIRPSLFTRITIETASSIIDDYLSGGCDQIIYFTDYDTIINQNKIAEFENFKNKYSEKEEVLICETMPSIEFWFLLHFQKTTQEFSNANEVVAILVKHLKEYSKSESYLKNKKWVQVLCSNDRFNQAISNSISILAEKGKNKASHFPFTKVHLGIQKFENQMQ